MVKEVEKKIISKAIFSDNNKYRYKLVRTWDEEKEKATIIALNPSTADVLKNDRTAMNINNFLIDNNYGSMTIVNLFAYRSKCANLLKHREEEHEEINDDYLIEAFENSDLIIVAWTRGKHTERKREVENILKKYKNKIKCFADKTGKKPRHPRDLGEGWTLEDYQFEFI